MAKSLETSLCGLLAACLLSSMLAFAQARPPAVAIPAPTQWPMEFLKDGTRLIVYQPQLRDWNRFRELTADTAISVTPSGGKPILGVVSWKATTLVDTQSRIVAINDLAVADARFPSLDAMSSAAMEQRVRKAFPAAGMTISHDRLLAGFKLAQAPPRVPAINTEPPPIVVSRVPAIIVFVDGEPIHVPIEGTALAYVVNSNWDLLFDKNYYYLLDRKTWLKAKELSGPWAVTTRLPPDMAKLPAGENWDHVRHAVPPAGGAKSAPRVVLASRPTELLLFSGEPAYTRIPGTNLAYAANTDSDVFVHYPNRRLYVLLSGRWFRAAGLDGPWSYAGNDLPSDFARIPPAHPRARVLVSVPGTEAARDAVLLAQVPTTAIVNRAEAEAKVNVAYAGDPEFIPIEGTSLAHAANTQERVIRYGDLYYLCFQGVWFVSASAHGPWKTVDSVPPAIYEIPPSSPVYNVTYVTVTNPTPTTVESSYSSGYAGVFLLGAAVGATVAYGTGHYYPPYYHVGPRPYPIYYPYPYTYGYRAVYNPATGSFAAGGVVYGPYGAAGRAAGYNAATGTYGRVASVQTASGGRTVAQAYNPWTGTYAATTQGHNAYAQWGSSVVQRGDDWVRAGHISTEQGKVARYTTSEGGSGTIISGARGQAGVVKTADDTVYAGKDGNVYKRDPNGDWNKYDDGNWVPVEKQTDRQRSASAGDSAAKTRQGSAPGTLADRQQKIAPERLAERAPLGQVQRPPAVSPDTARQLNYDALARQQGAARERLFRPGASGAGGRISRRR